MTDSTGQSPKTGAWLTAAAVGLAGDLEELRRCMLVHLDTLEALAKRRETEPPGDAPRVDGDSTLAQDLAEQFENDRHLLAAAWERLERERVESGGSRPGGAATAVKHPHPGDPSAHPDRPPPRPTPPDREANPVADTILRQFQTLCSDVRRTTDARFSSR